MNYCPNKLAKFFITVHSKRLNPSKPNPRLIYFSNAASTISIAYFVDKWPAIKPERACKIHASRSIHQVLPVLYLRRAGSPITLNQFTKCHLSRGERKNYFIFQTTEFFHALHPLLFSLSLLQGMEGWREWNLFGSGSVPVNRGRRSWKKLAIIRNQLSLAHCDGIPDAWP